MTMCHDKDVPVRPATARAKLVGHLTQEILSRDSPEAYSLASEHELCRQFNLSRVTVRLALGDLENRGLIYRRHGKGTYAHGRDTRVYRNIGILMRCTGTENRGVAELMRGMQSAQTELGAGIMLIGVKPAAWRPEMASMLSGVAILPWDVTQEDLAILRDRNLPFLLVGDSELVGPRITLGQVEAARRLTEKLLQQGHRSLAILSGVDAGLDEPKRRGIHEALRAAGLDPAAVPEFVADGKESSFFDAARKLLDSVPRPTGVIAFDDSLASILSYKVRRQMNLRVPEDISIVSFHDWPFLAEMHPLLCTVRFDFFAAGRQAAEALNRAAHTGLPVADLAFEPSYIEGETVGPPRSA
jgi:GntR family transcriptional regulator of arabinose operon